MREDFVDSLFRTLPSRPFILHAVGTSCVANSPRGSRSGHDHPSTRPFQIWLTERCAAASQCLEDGFFHENSALFPASAFAPLARTHRQFTVRLNQESAGWNMSKVG